MCLLALIFVYRTDRDERRRQERREEVIQPKQEERSLLVPNLNQTGNRGGWGVGGCIVKSSQHAGGLCLQVKPQEKEREREKKNRRKKPKKKKEQAQRYLRTDSVGKNHSFEISKLTKQTAVGITVSKTKMIRDIQLKDKNCPNGTLSQEELSQDKPNKRAQFP